MTTLRRTRDSIYWPGMTTLRRTRDSIYWPGMTTLRRARDSIYWSGLTTLRRARDSIYWPVLTTLRRTRYSIYWPGMTTLRRARDSIYWPGLTTLRRTRYSIYWPGLTRYIKQRNENCQAEKPSQQKETLRSHDILSKPWAKVGIDLFTYATATYLIMTDYYSGFFEFTKFVDQRAETTIQAVKHAMSSLHVMAYHKLFNQIADLSSLALASYGVN